MLFSGRDSIRGPLISNLVIFQPVSLVADDEVEVERLQQVGGSDEHLVTHDEDRVPRVLGVVAHLVGLVHHIAKVSGQRCSTAVAYIPSNLEVVGLRLRGGAAFK